jgi:hypothetical protein
MIVSNATIWKKTAIAATALLAVEAHAACNPANPPGTYEFYPGTGYYPSGTTVALPWQTPAGNAFEGFETYTNNSVIEADSNKSQQSHLEVTSGTLTSKYVGTSQYRRGKTDTYNFRMLLQGLSNGQRIKWTSQAVESRFYIDSWQSTSQNWQGVHLFARYRTENDLYVASLREDGTVVIKRKLCGVYSEPPLATGVLKDADGNPRPFNTKQWYTLTFSAIGNQLKFYVDDVLQLSATDGAFSWGTMGIRTDYANVYFDDVIVYNDLSGF